GIEVGERLEDAVGARRMVGRGHHGASARLLDRGADDFRVGRHHHLAHAGRLSARHHMGDHRLAGDVDERPAGPPGGGELRRDEDDDVARHWALYLSMILSENRYPLFGIMLEIPGRKPAYTGCQGRGKPAICAPPTGLHGPSLRHTTTSGAARRWI